MQQRVRILLIIGQCKTGGTETLALNYYKYLDHNRFAMDFLFFGDSLPRFENELYPNGDKVINVTDYTKNIFKSIWEIREVVRKGEYHIVHSQLNTLNFFPLLGAKLGGAKVRIASNHSTANFKYETKKTLVKHILRPSIKWMATDYTACSTSAAIWGFGEHTVKDGKVKIIPNAIDLSQFAYSDRIRSRVRKDMGWEGYFVIGNAARFTKQKNHSFIIDIFNEIHLKNPASLLVLVGEGHLMDNIKRKVSELHLDGAVLFLGLRFDINELMQGMDVFLFPSIYEGFGIAVIEAQAVGLRSVVSDAVPEEAVMTDTVDRVKLGTTKTNWSNIVLRYSSGYKRNDTHFSIEKRGYEIKKAVNDLEGYYLSLLM